jgi:hypothetical protein
MERVEVGTSYAPQADLSAIQKILTSVLLTFEESTGLAIDCLLHVEFWQGPPRVHYQLEEDGRTRISLSATDHFWCQYAYQFSHEICHIATNYDRAPRPPQSQPFAWLDETICELATWVTFRGLQRTWRANPMMSGEAVRQYREDLISQYKEKVDRRPFKSWFEEEQGSLRAIPIQREKNAKMAFEIMPEFYENGAGWRAASALNTWPVDPKTTINEFFADWIKAAPNEAKTIRLIADKFLL